MKKSKEKHDDGNEIKFINAYGNDMLSEMKGIDLQSFINELTCFYLTLRPKIGIDKNVTFGMEFEYENASYRLIGNEIEKHDDLSFWISTTDGTVNGGELVSPVCTDTKKTWNDLKIICGILKKAGAETLNCAGGHIHIGAPILTGNPDIWLRFFKVWTIYEKIIYRFSYGDKLFFRKLGKSYANPIGEMLYNFLIQKGKKNKIEIARYIIDNVGKYNGINFKNVQMYDEIPNHKNTIEFRCPNGSVEEVIWQNNVNLFTKLLLFCRKYESYDDIIDYKIKKYCDSDSFNSKKLYGEIYLSDALEFSDMIFNNNIDKIYFLRQYLKNFDDCCSGKKAKTFVK